jgi:hypothetical protein
MTTAVIESQPIVHRAEIADACNNQLPGTTGSTHERSSTSKHGSEQQ